ncbi:unnamed protein product, partial [Mesorhabditis belari]|uniref:Moesin/ezrin/radixin homolog 1 n=1 Tax=Mesorhabditis belari TaxID=2138241 RepID=A0AAF3E8L1_9BILA
MLKFAVAPWIIKSDASSASPRTIRRARPRESSAPSLRAARPRETTFGVEIDDSDIEHSWTPAMIGTQVILVLILIKGSSIRGTVGRISSAKLAALAARFVNEPTACTSAAQIHQRSHINSTPRKTSSHANGYGDYGNSNHSYTSQPIGTPRNGYSTNTTSSTVNRYAQPVVNGIRASSRPPPSTTNGTSPRSSLASSGYGGSSPPRTRRSPHSHKSNSPVDEDSIVTVRIRPDAQGRFGFNVKGGADQPVAVIVSKVVPGSSADKCYPRLNEGDQLLMINGRDVSTMAHDQVVAYIRAARNMPNGGELVLVIRPNVYRLGEELPEPDASCLPPEPVRVADTVPRSDKLSHSLRILAESLKNGSIITQFEQLYRRKPNLTMNDCRLSSNVNKNRYRDVCPYDATRVPLQSATTGDYINASFINMEIPASGIVNRYIACQGPLAHTTPDFWIMCWEQLCTTIVMLTTTVERGRVKCHQYWPRLYETQDHGRLTVTCLKDRETPNCSYREFTVKDKQSKEERRVAQMQYTAWPDHGVPDDPRHFIQFVDEVRRARSGCVEPIVVHCSAGIGRTGVLILMETASCLVEANEPVYPLEIVRVMRDQRAMLIQTPGQYTFVCESILRAYSDGCIKPLAEYQSNPYSG